MRARLGSENYRGVFDWSQSQGRDFVFLSPSFNLNWARRSPHSLMDLLIRCIFFLIYVPLTVFFFLPFSFRFHLHISHSHVWADIFISSCSASSCNAHAYIYIQPFAYESGQPLTCFPAAHVVLHSMRYQRLCTRCASTEGLGSSKASERNGHPLWLLDKMTSSTA